MILKCPKCGGPSHVLESRAVDDPPRTCRRRECLTCKRRWNTWEVSELEQDRSADLPSLGDAWKHRTKRAT